MFDMTESPRKSLDKIFIFAGARLAFPSPINSELQFLAGPELFLLERCDWAWGYN
jgi:hypothetical protein